MSIGERITRYWPVILIAWIVLACVLRVLAPAWDDVAADGDLAFLPPEVPSSRGRAALEKAFPGTEARSQLIIVLASPSELQPADIGFGLDLVRRVHWLAAKTSWAHYEENFRNNEKEIASDANARKELQESSLREQVFDNLSSAIEAEEALEKYLSSHEVELEFRRLPDAFFIREQLQRIYGDEESAAIDRAKGEYVSSEFPLLPSETPDWSRCFRDVWSWRTPIVAHKLGGESPQARLISIQLDSDFTAVRNMDVLASIEALIADLRGQHALHLSQDLRVEVTGSAAVGADMLRAAASGVRKTEVITVVLVLLILSVVYRAPLLVAIPLTSIGLSLLISTSLIALLARSPEAGQGMGLRVFTTTKIFVVVLLFGAGTDFCLFFLARVREQLPKQPVENRAQFLQAAATAWSNVSMALVASALTTIVGLALMWFSDFEKFQYSGLVIAISLGVTLCVCLTFTPALLCAFGKLAFWPTLRAGSNSKDRAPTESSPYQGFGRYWHLLAGFVAHQPRLALTVALALFSIPAVFGFLCLDDVTYDLTDELSTSAPSRRGADLVGEFFPTQDGSPISVLVTREAEFASEEQLQQACDQLTQALYVEGVQAVRSLTDPLGDYPPGKPMGLFDQDAWRRRLLRHRMTRELYTSPVPGLSNRVARFDVLVADNPFSFAAKSTLERLLERMDKEFNAPNSRWQGAQAELSGTTVGIADLRRVTQADQRRIQVLVTVGVWLVLMLLLRQLVLATYLIFTVLLSYFTTLGLSYAFFWCLYGPQYTGLDWKVPLFLFVILVAVGQDYNVYLVTRILEERRRFGIKRAVREALTQTGGIITSCGMVMAGTFIAMTSPAVLHWLGEMGVATFWDANAPVLRGITELGFALALGVLLDTLVVRSILVPAFVVLGYCEPKRRPPGAEQKTTRAEP